MKKLMLIFAVLLLGALVYTPLFEDGGRASPEAEHTIRESQVEQNLECLMLAWLGEEPSIGPGIVYSSPSLHAQLGTLANDWIGNCIGQHLTQRILTEKGVGQDAKSDNYDYMKWGLSDRQEQLIA